MKQFTDLYIENDKISAPFLLAASFNSFIEFVGSHSENGVLYWHFTPREKALTLLDQLHTKTEPHIPAQDLFTAIATFWKQVNKAKNEGAGNGRIEKY